MDKANIAAYIGGIVRILTTLIGGYLAQKGLATEAETEGLAGAAVLLGTGIWSIIAKRRALAAVPPAKVAGMVAVLLCLSSALLSGCAVVCGKAGESRYTGVAFGEKASSTLAGLNVTETTTAKGKITTDRGVGIDQAGSAGEADVSKMLGNLLLLGLQSQGVPVKAQAAAASQSAAPTADVADPAPDDAAAEVVYSTDGYSGSPGPAGEGVYGRPSCARCRAYASASPSVAIVNIDEPANRAAMWAALRRLGFSGTSAALPVAITSDAFAQPAK